MARDAEIRLKANDRELNDSLEKARKNMRSKMGALGKDLARSVGGAMRSALDIVGVGSVGAIVAAGRQVYTFQTSLTRLQISAGKTKAEMQALERQLFAVGKATATDPEQLLAGGAAFTALTGDLSTYTKGMEDLAKVSTATGANMDDLAKVAAALKTNLGVEGGDFGAAFDILAKQGKTGAVELNELAREMAGLTPQFATFGKGGVEGLRELGAMLQLTRSGFGTTSEAATGLQALMKAFVANAKQFKAGGLDVFTIDADGTKRVKNLSDLVYGLGESKLAKDPTKLSKALGSSEAYRALLPLLKAGRIEFEKMSSIDAKGTIGKDFATFMESSAGQMQSAGAAMKEAFNDALKNNIEGIAKAMKKVADAIAWIGAHPYMAAAAFAALRFGPAAIGAIASAGGGAAAAGLGSAAGGAASGVAGTVAGAAGGGLAARVAAGLGLNTAAGLGATAITSSATGGLGAIAAAGTGAAAAASAMVVGAGAAGYALGTLAVRLTALDEKIANLALGRGWKSDEDADWNSPARMAARRKNRKDAQATGEAVKGAGELVMAGLELPKYGFKGGSAEEIKKMIPHLDALRKSSAVAEALGLSSEQVSQLGPEELLRQFPTRETKLNVSESGMWGMSKAFTGNRVTLDKEKFAEEQNRYLYLGEDRKAMTIPQKVEVVVRVDDGGRIMAEVIDNAPAQGRR